MKLTTPPGTQDFMWFVTFEDGTYLTEIDHTTWERNNFMTINTAGITEYGLLGIGEKMYADVRDGTFYVLGQSVRFCYVEEQQHLQLTGYAQNLSLTKPYKQAQSVTVLSTGPRAEGRTYFEEISNILTYEFGISGELPTLTYVITLFMVKGEKMYMNIQLQSTVTRQGELQVQVNGQVTESFYAPLDAGEKGELNWTFKRSR